MARSRSLLLLPALLALLTAPLAAQQEHPTQFFIRLKNAATAQITLTGGLLFSDPLLQEKLAAGEISSARPLFPPARAFRKGAPAEPRPPIYLLTARDSAARVSLMRQLAASPAVEYVEPNRFLKVDFVPNDSAYGSQWALKKIEMEQAWEATKGSTAVRIGVIDTGIDYTHEDLRSQLWINPAEDINHNGTFEPWPATETRNGITGDFDGIDQDGNGYADDVIGYDFTDQSGVSNAAGGDYDQPDPDPADDFGHGTSVSGIIAAATDNGKGIAGIAPGCRLVTLRAFNALGVGTEADVARALAYAADMGVQVVNMSFGDVSFSRVLRDVVRYAYRAGVAMVASAGNSGSAEIHYPSGYDETVSVGASTANDGLAGFSNYGASVDLVAPGVDIVTTDRENRYTSFNGTSASAPFVTGVAALILTLHPEFTPEEVRGVLVASAYNVGGKGWSDYTAAGRLDAAKAVAMDQPTIVRIYSPKTDFATGGSVVPIVGTAASPLMRSYMLQYGAGATPSQWIDIVPPAARQVVNDTLALWDISGLPDSTYVIRLAAVSDKGITIEDRVTIAIDHTKPVFLGVGFVPAIDGDGYGVAAGFQTDEPTLGKIFYRRKNSGDPWNWISAEGNTENNLFIGTIHYFFVGKKYLLPETDYEFYFSAINKAGLETAVTNGGSYFTTHTGGIIPTAGFLKKPWSLPASRLFPVTTDFNNNGRKELLLNDVTAGNRLKVLEFDNGSFDDLTPPTLLDRFPRAVGDANGNGKTELLASIVRRGILYEQPAANTVPSAIIWADTTSDRFWPCAIADVNDDGKQEVVAITSDSTIGIFTLSASNVMQQIATLVNPTAPPPGGHNTFGSPTVAIGDFNGNGRTEMLFGDEDGDFFIYETRGGNSFEATWIAENDFEQGSDFVAAGDFDGDGKKEIVLGFRTGASDIIPFWYFTIRKLNIQNVSTPLWEQAFYGIEESSAFGAFSKIQNSITVGNVDQDPADELVITTFPELYIIKYNPATKTCGPIWMQPLVNTNSAVIADLDRNGINEVGFALQDSVVFYERDVPYAGPSIPSSVDVAYLTATSVRLAWTAPSAAPAYRVYKGDSPSSLSLLGTMSANGFTDFDIVAGKSYVYAVAGYDSTRTPAESPKVISRLLHPHDPPVIDSARFAGSGQVLLFVSQEMGTAIPHVSSLSLNGTRTPESVALLGRRRILLTFDQLSDGDYFIAPSGLRDAEGMPFDPAGRADFGVTNAAAPQFYILRIAYVPEGRIDVWFNMEVDSITAANASNYQFSPAGKVQKAEVDPADRTLVHLTLSREQPIGALGREYRVSVRNVRSSTGIPIVSGAGSTAGIIINRDNLENMFVFPNPWRAAEGTDAVTFANLTARARIRIYTLSGMFIREILEEDGNGGAEWDMLDADGKRVPSGIYIYYATGTNARGVSVDPKTGKLAILR